MGAEPPQPAWRAAIDADRRKRPRRLSSERAALRQLTSAMLVAAVGLNLALFVQTGAESVGLGGLKTRSRRLPMRCSPAQAHARQARPRRRFRRVLNPWRRRIRPDSGSVTTARRGTA